MTVRWSIRTRVVWELHFFPSHLLCRLHRWVVMFSSACDLTMNLLPGQKLSASWTLPAVQQLYSDLLQFVTAVVSTTASAADMDATNMNARLNMASLEMLMNLFSVAPGFTPSTTLATDLASKVFPNAGLPTSTRVNMPSSCNMQQYMSTGQCPFAWNGLTSLFGQDLTISVNIQRCVNYPSALPSINVQVLVLRARSFSRLMLKC